MSLPTTAAPTAAPSGPPAAAHVTRLADALTAAALAAISIVYLWPFRNASFLDPDEGIVLQGAARILHGQLPYRDFFAFYTPGSYFWNAGLMKIFGDSILVPRTVLVLYGVLFSVLTFVLARRMASRLGALVVSLLLLLICVPARFLVLPNWDSTAAALLALYCALGHLRRPGPGWAFGTGLFASLTMLCNQARGTGLALGLLLGFLVLRYRRPASLQTNRHFLAMGAVFALPLAATAAFFAAQGGLGIMIQDLLWAPRNYTHANQVPYGFITMRMSSWVELFDSGPMSERALHYFIISPIFILCALPIALVLIALWCAWKPRPDLDPTQVSAAILSGAVVLGSLLSILPRPDFLHIGYLSPLFFFLVPWVVERWAAPFSGLKKAAPLAGVYLLCALTAYALTWLWPVRGLKIQQQTRRGTIRVEHKSETIEFIQAHFPPGSSLLVYPYLPFYSFLTRTFSPLPYDYLQPGMHTREQFEEGAARLKTLRPGAVLYEPDFIGKIPTAWPRTSLTRIVQDPVADFIVENYRVCAAFDRESRSPLLLMVRKDLPCSAYR